MTTVTEKSSFTTKLAYVVNETGNLLTSCDKRRRVFCPGKWRIFRTKRTIGADSSGKTGIFPDDNGKSERICEAPQMANMASQLHKASWASYAKGLVPHALCCSCPRKHRFLCSSCPRKHRFLWTDSIKNQLLSMKSWVLVDRMQNNRDFTLSQILR